MTAPFRIAVLPGDGIGPEVVSPALAIMDRALERAGAPPLETEALAAGAGTYRATGEALPEATVDAARGADAIFLGAMGLPDVRRPDGREVVPQVDLRTRLGLYAGVRPVRTIPGVRPVLAGAPEVDFVIVRESIEGLFAPQAPGTREADREARETLVVTREVTAKVVDFAFRLARARGRESPRVTSVDKANVFQAFAFWREVFHERAGAFADVGADAAYVDAFAMTMVQRPHAIDVAVTENMFGDILSDLGAAIMGGMGYAPSADIGDDHAVFQPCHGTAPDIAGQGIANPVAAILSGAMMLEWLGARRGDAAATAAGGAIRRAVDTAFAGGGLVTAELGGSAGTGEVAAAVARGLD